MNQGGMVVRGAFSPPDDQAFALVFREHAPGAYRLAVRLCGDAQAAEDVVAEAFAKVLVRWRGGQVADPGAYLRRAVVNQVTSGFRRRAVERRYSERRRGDDRGEQAFAERHAEQDAFRHALARLGPRQRAVIVLRYWEDLPEAAIAEAMGCSVGTVKSQLHRALANLRRELGANSPDLAAPGALDAPGGAL